jgi:hypothetical protein
MVGGLCDMEFCWTVSRRSAERIAGPRRGLDSAVGWQSGGLGLGLGRKKMNGADAYSLFRSLRAHVLPLGLLRMCTGLE